MTRRSQRQPARRRHIYANASFDMVVICVSCHDVRIGGKWRPGAAMTNTRLQNRRILVVEDEFLAAEDLRYNLEGAGAVVIGPAPSVQSALALMENELALDAALLDVNLGGTMSFPVAEALVARSVPFVFTSGYDDGLLAKHFALMPRCQKPADFASIVTELATILPD